LTSGRNWRVSLAKWMSHCADTTEIWY
jgi:hypothetical protein